jgi:N-acylglucosamine-6-phosphate 2-epimerase
MTGDPIAALRGGLIVSVQTSELNPLHGSEHVGALARAAELGGAAAVRVDSPEHVAIVRAVTGLPLMGIYTRSLPGSDVLVTPTFESARAIVAAGAEIVSVDGTGRQRPGGEELRDLVRRVHEELEVPVMADVSSLEQGLVAREAGADVIGSAIEGYERAETRSPDIGLVRDLVERLDCPVIAERHFTTTDEVRAAMAAGAHAVVVGSAIVDPTLAVRRFADAVRTPEGR